MPLTILLIDTDEDRAHALEDIRALSVASPVVMFAGTNDPGPDRCRAEGGNQLRLLH